MAPPPSRSGISEAASHCHRAAHIDQNCSSCSGGGTASIDAMTRQAVWGCLLAASVHARPDCLVELDGSYISTQVDVLSPKHDERYTEGEAIPLGLEVQAWPVDIAARRDVRLCVVLDELEPACIPVADQSLPTLTDLRLGEHVVSAYLALQNSTVASCSSVCPTCMPMFTIRAYEPAHQACTKLTMES